MAPAHVQIPSPRAPAHSTRWGKRDGQHTGKFYTSGRPGEGAYRPIHRVGPSPTANKRRQSKRWGKPDRQRGSTLTLPDPPYPTRTRGLISSLAAKVLNRVKAMGYAIGARPSRGRVFQVLGISRRRHPEKKRGRRSGRKEDGEVEEKRTEKWKKKVSLRVLCDSSIFGRHCWPATARQGLVQQCLGLTTTTTPILSCHKARVSNSAS